MALKPLKLKSRITHITLAKTLRVLLDGPATVHEIAEVTGVMPRTAAEWMRALRKEECAHISGWVPDSRGRDATAVFSLGKGKDKPRHRFTEAERQARRRAKKRQLHIQSLITGVAQ
jgi:predicted ArsR family transcriptional regulator